jgi:hypothetical protein
MSESPNPDRLDKTGHSSLDSDDLPMVVPMPSQEVLEEPASPPPKKRRKKRQDMLNCKFLDLQSKVGDEGESEDLSTNSSDDGSQSNISNVSSGSHHSNASPSVYLNSLTSQAEEHGFEPPLNAVRRSAPFA